MCDLVGRSCSVTSPTGCNSMGVDHSVCWRRGEASSSHHYIKKLCTFSRKPKKQAKYYNLLQLWVPKFWNSSWSAPVCLSPWALNLLFWDISNMLAQSSRTDFQALQRRFTQWAHWHADLSGKEVIMQKLTASISIPSLSTWGADEMNPLDQRLRRSSCNLLFTLFKVFLSCLFVCFLFSLLEYSCFTMLC